MAPLAEYARLATVPPVLNDPDADGDIHPSHVREKPRGGYSSGDITELAQMAMNLDPRNGPKPGEPGFDTHIAQLARFYKVPFEEMEGLMTQRHRQAAAQQYSDGLTQDAMLSGTNEPATQKIVSGIFDALGSGQNKRPIGPTQSLGKVGPQPFGLSSGISDYAQDTQPRTIVNERGQGQNLRDITSGGGGY
jgi:hypothetical protein